MPASDKLLIICGPTATGKTKLAYDLAKKFNGELISADSRMVYKYMDIGTGKDVKKYGKILGYDLADPDEEFSISQYSAFGRQKIQEIQNRKHLPILVGGSGLYIKAVTDKIDSIDVSPNETLRDNLKDKTVEQLAKLLKNSNLQKYEKMNNSDRNNPRRLIRAIEIAMSDEQEIKQKSNYDSLFVGLTLEKDILKERIQKRVDERIKEGMENEIKFLKEKKFWNGAPSKTIGYKNWPDIEKWKIEEVKYAKRQMTWFKKQKQINWFDVSNPNFAKDVVNLIQKWYPSHINAAEN
jgi:tRNA dimethylallyltransferase